MPELTVKWHTHPELRQTVDFCDICDNLNGSEWTFHTDREPFPPVLSHPSHGVVWDCDADQSRAHGSHRYNCHCTLTWVMNDEDLASKIHEINMGLRDRLLALRGATETWSGRGKVSVVRSPTGQFVTWRPI
jgi:hypothetical protein